MQNRIEKSVLLLALALVILLLFCGAPANGSFDWSDAPRHALNGVFLRDFIGSGQWQHPTQFAYDYYAQYPALTILFYPPLFYIISAPFYALFGVSEHTALLVVALHYLAFSWGCWYLFRNWLSDREAALAALVMSVAPEIAYWGRQVMLEIPAYAFLVWSAVFFIRYRNQQRVLFLYCSALLLVLAMYTKISTAFLGLAFAVTLLMDRKLALLRDKHIWIVTVLSVLVLIPLIIITLKFGQANVQSVTGVADSVVSRHTLAGWLWYVRQFPAQIGWPVTACAAAAMILALLRQQSAGLTREDLRFWCAWLICGYLFFSAIDLKEARHSVFILPPLVLAAFLLLKQISPAWLSKVLLIALPLVVTVQTLLWRPVHYVEGYAAAADFIAQHAPAHSRVLFSGYRDGSFIFNMRTHEERRDLSVIRADKLLLSVSVRRELGVTQKNLDEQDITAQINRLGVHYLVVQPGFWDDLAVMKKFENVLGSTNFQLVARIATPANFNAHEKELLIYKNLGKVNDQPSTLELGLPIIGTTITTVH